MSKSENIYKVTDRIEKKYGKYFTVIPNNILKNPNLPPLMIGVLTYIFSNRINHKTNSWQIYETQVMHHFEHVTSHYKIRKAFKEMKKFGYLIHNPNKDSHGRYQKGSKWILVEHPSKAHNKAIKKAIKNHTFRPEMASERVSSPNVGQPATGQPNLGQSTSNKNQLQSESINQKQDDMIHEFRTQKNSKTNNSSQLDSKGLTKLACSYFPRLCLGATVVKEAFAKLLHDFSSAEIKTKIIEAKKVSSKNVIAYVENALEEPQTHQTYQLKEDTPTSTHTHTTTTTHHSNKDIDVPNSPSFKLVNHFLTCCLGFSPFKTNHKKAYCIKCINSWVTNYPINTIELMIKQAHINNSHHRIRNIFGYIGQSLRNYQGHQYKHHHKLVRAKTQISQHKPKKRAHYYNVSF